MNTLEEEIIVPLQRQMAEQSSFFQDPMLSSRPKPGFFWKFFLTAGVGLVIGVSTAGLFLQHRQLAASTRDAIARFNWLVMSGGDSLAVDEIGRYLGKIDGVADVTFVSADDVLANVKGDPLLADDVALLPDNPFPSAWKVRWKPADFSVAKIQSALDDVRGFPGVLDVASDPQTLQRIQAERNFLARIERVLLLLGLVAGLFTFVFLLRFIFSRSARQFNRKAATLGVLVAIFSLAAGAGAVYLLW